MAMIIEPIQQLGTYFASKEFYKALEGIIRENKAALIIDESFSGFGGSGRMWAHEHFDLNPDILTFGGKCQASGFFMKKEFRPPQAWQIISTWCGDPLRVEMLRGIKGIVSKDNLIAKAGITGKYILEHLEKVLVKKNRGKNLRGIGLHIAFDLETKESAWEVSAKLLTKGIHVNVINPNVIQIHPSLIFDRKHADIFLDRLEESL